MSEVSICNQALTLIGAQTIISLGDDTKEAKLCSLNYAPVRDAVLSESDWTFATRWQELAKSADPAPGEFTNEYPLPSDVLAVLFVGENYNNPEHWRLEDNAIRTDANKCKCQVLYRVEDTSKFSSLFTQAFVARLAAELAIPITNSRTLMENMFVMYEQKMKTAAARDSQQGKSRRIRSTWLSLARARNGQIGAGPYV